MLIFRSVIVWLAIVAAESLHGTLRRLFLEPAVGDFRARQIGVFTGAAIVFAIACVFVRRLRAENAKQLLAVGFIWLILTAGFEFGLGRFVLNYSWERLLSDYNLAAGGLMPLGLVVLTLSPLLAARWRGNLK